MKKLIPALLICLTLTGCVTISESPDEEMRRKTKWLMAEVNKQLWLPAIVNFQEKKLAKMIFELRDQEKLSTFTYITAKNTGKQMLLCKSMGYGLPYSVQYTNPMKEERVYNWAIALPQADPNWLFMPDGLSATWVMCIDPWTKQPRPVYVENEIIVSPFKL